MIQKTLKDQKPPKILFKGDSCYPHSPLSASSGAGSEIHMSSEDQMIKIVETLDIKDKDVNFIEPEDTKNYINHLRKHVDVNH